MSAVQMTLRAEGAVVAGGAIAAYFFLGTHPWWLILALFLVPDLAFVVYFINKAAGIAAYNLVHNYMLPVGLTVASLYTGWNLGLSLALIWFFHIGVDRAVGYGIKYVGESKDTHIQRA